MVYEEVTIFGSCHHSTILTRGRVLASNWARAVWLQNALRDQESLQNQEKEKEKENVNQQQVAQCPLFDRLMTLISGVCAAVCHCCSVRGA